MAVHVYYNVIFIFQKQYKQTQRKIKGRESPDLAQLAEHLTVVVVVIKGSPVRIR